MELIRKEKSRMLTFRKRKAGLLKKASEFSILCGVDACVIVFGPKQNDDQQPSTAETWPPNSDEVRCIINKYKDSDQPKKCYQVSDYFADKRKQVDSELARLHKQIIKAKYPAWDDRLNGFYADQLRLLLSQLDAKIEIADKKLGNFKELQNGMDNSAPWVQATSLSPNVLYDMESFTKNRDDSNNRYPTNCFQLIHNPKPLDAQPPILFYPEQSSHMTNLLEPTDLQLYSERRPLNVQLPVHFQSKQNAHEYTMSANFWDWHSNNLTDLQLSCEAKSLNVQQPMHFQSKQTAPRTSSHPHVMEDVYNQNNRDQFSFKSSSNKLPFVNHTPWMWDNVWFNNADSSMTYIAPTKLPVTPSMQFPMSGFPHQMHSSEVSDFSGDIEFEGKGQGYQ
ncbi:unnamed protein product [Dovyalis caffra]|uniref:MADS-box domain-containing protein n=1 Tax=Dovyalis caffra TaxID=77055 RepID=A0AAV1S2J8_9ROSI|nr:unnamed protein product [Dovyalis caffra]